MQPLTPPPTAARMSSPMLPVVTTRMGAVLPSGRARSWRARSSPPMPGMFHSVMTNPTEASNRSSASRPPPASTTSVKPMRSSELTRMRRRVAESSTTRNFMVRIPRCETVAAYRCPLRRTAPATRAATSGEP